MPPRKPNRVLKETPVERIFRKVVGRKMTAAERKCFELKPAGKVAKANRKNASGNTHRSRRIPRTARNRVTSEREGSTRKQ